MNGPKSHHVIVLHRHELNCDNSPTTIHSPTTLRLFMINERYILDYQDSE